VRLPHTLCQKMSYLLPNHVYVCKTADAVVFLDLRRDRYFGLSGPQMHALASVVAGWPVHGTPLADVPQLARAQGERVADLMVNRGLLTNSQAGKSATPVIVETPQAALTASRAGARAGHVHLRDIVRFIASWMWTTWTLRRRSLESVIRDIESRKHRSRGSLPNARTIVELVEIFRHLRRYTFTAKDRCLFHALVLVTFLSRYGYSPTLVMGVRTMPWSAHSWVQDGGYVLDSTPEDVAAFTPILAI
jgi:hypothetical protein